MSESINDDLLNASNRDVQMGKETDKSCPACSRDARPFFLHVRADYDGSATLECPNCTYTLNVPSNTLSK